VPRAGPLRYWSLTLIGVAIVLGSLATEAWGLYNLIGTDSCGTTTTQECSSDTALHILAVTVGPFVGIAGMILLAFRGGGTRTWLSRFRPKSKRLADRIARGEAPMPEVERPAASPPVPSQTPLNRTWPPATWEPSVPARQPEASPIDRLRELDELKERGLISVAEHEAQKKRILGGT
jgi:hypothetical protein